MMFDFNVSYLLKLIALAAATAAALAAALELPPGDDFVGDWPFWAPSPDMSTSMTAVGSGRQ